MCMAYFSCNPSSPLPPLFSQKHTYIIPLLSPYVSCYYVHILHIMYIILRLYYLSEMPPSNITGFMKTVPAVYTLAQQYMQVRERTVSKKHSVCFPPFSILTQSYYYVHIPPPPPTLSCYYVQFFRFFLHFLVLFPLFGKFRLFLLIIYISIFKQSFAKYRDR